MHIVIAEHIPVSIMQSAFTAERYCSSSRSEILALELKTMIQESNTHDRKTAAVVTLP